MFVHVYPRYVTALCDYISGQPNSVWQTTLIIGVSTARWRHNALGCLQQRHYEHTSSVGVQTTSRSAWLLCGWSPLHTQRQYGMKFFRGRHFIARTTIIRVAHDQDQTHPCRLEAFYFNLSSRACCLAQSVEYCCLGWASHTRLLTTQHNGQTIGRGSSNCPLSCPHTIDETVCDVYLPWACSNSVTWNHKERDVIHP